MNPLPLPRINETVFAALQRGDTDLMFRGVCDIMSLRDYANVPWRLFLARASRLSDLPDATHRFWERTWIGVGDVIRRQVGDDALIADALHVLTRPYSGRPLALYRGQSRADFDAGRLGFSWSTSFDAASTFGRCHRWNRNGGVVILKITEAAPALVSVLRSGSAIVDRMIAEVLVDVRHLTAAPEVVAMFDGPPTNIERLLAEFVHPPA